jgi:hypothetical protein
VKNSTNAGILILTGDNDVTIANSVISNNNIFGVQANSGTTWLAKTVISGNGTGVFVGAHVNSYGNNCISDNTTPVNGSLTPVTTQ